MIDDEERKRAVAELREASTGAYRHVDSLDVIANSIGVEVAGKLSHEVENETYAALADLIDRPMCHDLVEHKQDPFIPGKRMADGYFHCSSCDWSGQLWEYIGFGGMLAYEPVHCPKCGEKIERVGELVPGA